MMASEDEEAPCAKRIKLDPAVSEDNSVRILNSLFPKIENLEYFPLKVLLQIFASVDDISLVNLAESSTRFERIAKMVINERYSHEYLAIDYKKYHSEPSNRYADFFQFFGSEIKSCKAKTESFEAIRFHRKDNTDFWFMFMLNSMKNLEKLKVEISHLTRYINEGYFLQNYVTSKITHLTLHIGFIACYVKKGLLLSKFCNLKKLELINRPCILFETLKEAIQNNPGLESLCISDNYEPERESVDIILREYPLNELMMLFVISGTIRLKEFAYVLWYYERYQLPDVQTTRQPDHIVEAFVDSLKYLESLALSLLAVNFFTDFVELFRRLAQRCKNIKHLKLYHIHGEYNEIFKTIRLFDRIESLTITMYDLDYDSIVSLVEKLPFLYDLHIALHVRAAEWSFVSTVLSKCQSLEKLAIASTRLDGDFELLTSAQFYHDFKTSTQMRNVKIKVISRDQVIGKITKNQIIWRNKLLHWTGYDPNLNLSQIHLLDLVNKSTVDSNSKRQCDTIGPFDVVLSYLDWNSLHSLSKTNRKCSELVDCYMKRHSKQRGSFTITNEFFTPHNTNYKQLGNNFIEHVTDLKVNIYHHNIAELRNIIGQFHNLNKLHVYTAGYEVPSDMIFPHVRHLIFDGKFFQRYSEFYELSRLCPDLKILELKQPNLEDGNFINIVRRLAFRELENFTFFCGPFTAVDHIDHIFKDTDTKVYVNTSDGFKVKLDEYLNKMKMRKYEILKLCGLT